MPLQLDHACNYYCDSPVHCDVVLVDHGRPPRPTPEVLHESLHHYGLRLLTWTLAPEVTPEAFLAQSTATYVCAADGTATSPGTRQRQDIPYRITFVAIEDPLSDYSG